MGHTPGPWTVGEHRGVWVGPVVHAGGKGVAFVVGSEDNARLIAAAPRMFALLKKYFLTDTTVVDFTDEAMALVQHIEGGE